MLVLVLFVAFVFSGVLLCFVRLVFPGGGLFFLVVLSCRQGLNSVVADSCLSFCILGWVVLAVLSCLWCVMDLRFHLFVCCLGVLGAMVVVVEFGLVGWVW